MRFALLITVLAVGSFQLIATFVDVLTPVFLAGGYL